jgi:hypothetical protein
MTPLLSVAAGGDRTLQVAGGQGRVPAKTTLLRSTTILEYVTDSNGHSRKKGMTMRITMNHIVPLVAGGAAAVAIAAAPTAAATKGTARSNVQQTPGYVQIVASPGSLL